MFRRNVPPGNGLRRAGKRRRVGPVTDRVNIADALAAAAARDPGAPALILPGGARVSYRELDGDADRIARGFARAGLEPGTRAVLLVPPGRDFFPLVFGLLRAGAVPVVVDPGMGLAKARRCLLESAPGAFVGTGKAFAARWLTGLGGRIEGPKVGVGMALVPGGMTLDRVRRLGGDGGADPAPTTAASPAAILFTSGSTGPPRGAIYSHGNFAAQVELVRRTFSIEPGEVDLPTFPLFALFDPALGMTTVVPEMDPSRPARADPAKLARAILGHGVTTMFGSPALLEPLARFCEGTGTRFPTLRRVVSAGAPVPARTVERFARALPEGALLHTPYGATEALPVASIAHPEILGETAARTAAGEGVCVGRPVEGVEVRVIRVEDGEIPRFTPDLEVPAGTTGEFVVRGPQVTRGYFGRPEADLLTKIGDPAGGFWHRMGDLGYRDASGRLWFCGRRSQRVRTEGGDLCADQCEGVFNAHPMVRRSAVVGVGEAGRQRPVAVIERARGGPHLREGEPEGPRDPVDDGRLAEEVLALGSSAPCTRGIRDVLLYRGILPVDTRHNAKIRREVLAAWAAKRLGRA